MTWKETFVDVVTTPWVIATGIVASLLEVLHLLDVVSFVTALSTEWFGVLAIASSTLAPKVDWLPTDLLLGVFVGVSIIVLIDRTDRTISWMRDRYS